MKNPKIVPIILAGGSGSRLWPISREDMPKQFCTLGQDLSLFQQTANRVNDDTLFLPPIVVTGQRYSEIVRHQLDAVGCTPQAIICEPFGRDTAAAILIAAEVVDCSENDVMMMLPSDHKIGDDAAFHDATREAAVSAVVHDRIVTFGIKPSAPETGFGYIRGGEKFDGLSVCRLESFIEKPDAQVAEVLLRDPAVYWNAGIFLMKPGVLRGEAEQFAKHLLGEISHSALNGYWRGLFFYPEIESFGAAPSISIDHAIMEKTLKAAMLPVDPQWSDLGSWKALWEISQKGRDGSVVGKNCFAEDAKNCLLRSDGPVVGVAGLEDIVVVASKDAVLVTSRSNPQGVKSLVETMREKNIPAATRHAGEDRPWGRFDSLDTGDVHQVKRIRVDPGQRLSLQYHHHRAEHWVVVAGTATVTVDENVVDLNVGEQIFIPLGAVHRLDNFTDDLVEIIEVQIGSNLGEDDIVRVEDVYGREPEPINTNQEAA